MHWYTLVLVCGVKYKILEFHETKNGKRRNKSIYKLMYRRIGLCEITANY